MRNTHKILWRNLEEEIVSGTSTQMGTRDDGLIQDSSGCKQDTVAVSCEHRNKPSGYIRDGNFLIS